MKHRLLCAILCACLLLCSVGLLSSCGKKQTVLLSLDGHTVTANAYQFLLSRVRGTLDRGGYPVTDDDFWTTVIASDGTTYDGYVRQAALNDAKRYLAALALMDEEGLTLPKATLDKIDESIEEAIRDAGSKAALNSQLAAFGANVDTLREVYVLEAKYEYLQAHLYGENGSKIAANVVQEYLDENVVAFRQLLIRAFDYVYEKDLNNDEIYYLPNENNAKVNNIAYDTVRGTVRLDEYGKTIVDKNGDSVYYLPDGKIAYDTEKGVRAMTYDENGNPKTVKYTKDELAEHKEAAEGILESIEEGDFLAFEAILEEYKNGKEDAFVTDGDLCFLYVTGDNSVDYLNDIADKLDLCDEGEMAIIESEYGYNVVMKYPVPSDAATNTEYKDWFSDLSDRVITKLFDAKCRPYMDRVTVDADAFAAIPPMKEIGTNYYY